MLHIFTKHKNLLIILKLYQLLFMDNFEDIFQIFLQVLYKFFKSFCCTETLNNLKPSIKFSHKFNKSFKMF